MGNVTNLAEENEVKMADVINIDRNQDTDKKLKKKLDGTPKKIMSCNSVKGNPHEVYPLKSVEDINAMINYFLDKIATAVTEFSKQIAGRNLMMLVLGMNVALRASDLLKLTWGDVFDSKGEFRDFRRIQEQKTAKYKNLFFNDGAKYAIKKYIEEFNPDIKPTGYLFKSREAGAIDVGMCCKILKEAAIACGLPYNVGSHTLRKTFGYWYIKNNNNSMTALAELQDLLNHSSQKATLKYIGLWDEKAKKCYESNVIGMGMY